ncbi:MAG: acetamidase [Lentisphaerae bacterium]|jgi:amidase|nr:acetamidase [Lentisphaerota bacterium]MBT4817187.1 acetamidase [Lentisphaerota bacterium]MBT5609399.1 acetamidase [Lentisphaerota bacterium]MBT7060224.1 acetamidase [Lentisphaerota bacterium]MBT7841707.1 acetamidase [Lentisphaerota bacterium]
MQRISTETLYFETGAGNTVTHTVQPGELFEVQTQINRGPWIDRLPEAEQTYWRERLRDGNPTSGCIRVEGVRPGDMLSVDVGEIQVDPIAYTSFGGNNGAMPGWLDIGAHAKVVEVRDGLIHWSDELKLTARPMLGFVGVAPEKETLHNGWGGEWGGNLDAPEVTTGAALHLRVHHEGALLHVGDMHALQGDGEICGAGGIECGGRVQLTCRIAGAAPEALRFPRIETDTHIAVAANAVPAEDAFRIALVDLLNWLKEDYGMAYGDAYLLLGQVLEARVTQFVNPSFTYIAKVAKKYLP